MSRKVMNYLKAITFQIYLEKSAILELIFQKILI